MAPAGLPILETTSPYAGGGVSSNNNQTITEYMYIVHYQVEGRRGERRRDLETDRPYSQVVPPQQEKALLMEPCVQH